MTAFVGFHVPSASADSSTASMTAGEIVNKAVDADPWGRSGTEATARVTVLDKVGKKRELVFGAKSLRYSPPLSKSLLHFTAPADVSGMKFLQVQKNAGDDERTLYLPELKRSRRIAGSTRSTAFMGTDFTYADMDRRDIREGSASLKSEENIGKYPCYHVTVTPKASDSEYSRIEMWVRKDVLIPLKWEMYNKSNALSKTLVTKELQKHADRWHITRSLMTDVSSGRTSEVLIEKIEPRDNVNADQFTVGALEKD